MKINIKDKKENKEKVSTEELVSPGIFAGNERVPVTNFRRDFTLQAKKFREMCTIGKAPEREGAKPEYSNGGKPLKYQETPDKIEPMPDLEKRVKIVNESVTFQGTVMELVEKASRMTPLKDMAEEEVTIPKSADMGKRIKGSKESANDTDYKLLSLPKKEAYNQLLGRLRLLSYPQYLSQLKAIISSDKLEAIFSEGFDAYSEVKISKKELDLPVSSLLPTQNQLNLSKSLDYPFTGKEPLDTYFSDKAVTIVGPIITFNQTFVIDGHHRWAQTAIINPKAKISCIDFQSDTLTPIQFLKLIQGAIAMEKGEIPSVGKDEGVDLYKSARKKIESYVESNLKDSVRGGLVKRLKLQTNDEAVDYIIANTLSLKYNNLPAIGSPSREKMPQVKDTPGALDKVQESPAITVAEEAVEDDTTSIYDLVKNKGGTIGALMAKIERDEMNYYNAKVKKEII